MKDYSSVDFCGDFHSHSIASIHAYNTIFENIARAKELGFSFLAITDHGIGFPDGPVLDYFNNLVALPRIYNGVTVLRGVEANIMDGSGRLDMPETTFRRLDVVIASIHRQTFSDCGFDACTEAYLGVSRNPFVKIIGHCGTAQFKFNYERVIPVFGEYGKIVEMNTHSFICRKDSYENCKEIMSLCKKHGVRIAVNSDAHVITEMGLFSEARAMLSELDFPVELIVNASKENANSYFESQGFDFRI